MLAFALFGCGKKNKASKQPPAPLPESMAAPNSVPPEQQRELEPLPVAKGINALTGLPKTETMFDGQRPVAIMIANNSRALPQRGVASADVIYEMLTEGGITRLMAMYADSTSIHTTGPVRSTRDQFVQFAYPSKAVLAHIGASVYGSNLIKHLGYQTLDGIHLGTIAFGFDAARCLPRPGGKLNEYCWFTDSGPIAEGMKVKEIPASAEVRTLFKFAKSPEEMRPDALRITASYSDVSASEFNFLPEEGLYSKTIFGQIHADEDGTPLRFTNVILLRCNIGQKEDGVLPDFDLAGGDGYYFHGGGAQALRWEKGDPTKPLRLFDLDGDELEIQPGKSYIGLVPAARQGAISFLSSADLEAAAAQAALSASAVPAA